MDLKTFLQVWNAIAQKATEEGHGDGKLQDVDELQRYAVMHKKQTLQQILEAHYERKALEDYFIAWKVFDQDDPMEDNWEELNDSWVYQIEMFQSENNLEAPPFEAEEEEIEKFENADAEDSKEEDELRKVIGIKELPKQKAAPEKTVRKEAAPQQVVRQEAAHRQAVAPEEREREEALTRIDAISNRLAEFVKARRATRDLLQSRVDASSKQAVIGRAENLNKMKYELNQKEPSLRQDLEKLGEYLNHRDDRIFDKNGRKTLRRLQADIQTNLDKKADLESKIVTEVELLCERARELRSPVGSDQNFLEAMYAFKAIQDKQLSFGRTGGHANEFNAIKEAVQALDDNYQSVEAKMAVYNACYAYLSKHTTDGSHIGGQKSEVGRLRKQAVVNLLQVLSREPDVKAELREVEKNEPNRMKLNFAELEKSLAKKTGMKKVDNKYLLGTKRKAYAELKAEQQRAEAAAAEAAVRRPR